MTKHINKLADQRTLIDVLIAILIEDVGSVEDFPYDMVKQSEWRTQLHEDIARIEREMCIYLHMTECGYHDD